MAVVFIGLNPWAGNFPSESWDLEFCPNFALFFLSTQTHSIHILTVYLKHYLSVPFLIWRPQATSVLGVFPCSPISTESSRGSTSSVQFWPNVHTKDDPFLHNNHLVRPDRLTPPWAKSDSPIAAKLWSSDLCQDINQIFFPLSSQHHNVRYWPSQLPSSIRPWTRTTRVPCHLITRLKPSYKSTFVGVILHVSAPSLNQSRFTPTSAYTSSFSDKYPPHYSSW